MADWSETPLVEGETLPERANREGDSQALPTKNDRPFIQDAVIADIEARKAVGIKRYGTALQPFNGRDALLDLYEELLDACVYLKQALVERDSRPPAVLYDQDAEVKTPLENLEHGDEYVAQTYGGGHCGK